MIALENQIFKTHNNPHLLQINDDILEVIGKQMELQRLSISMSCSDIIGKHLK